MIQLCDNLSTAVNIRAFGTGLLVIFAYFLLHAQVSERQTDRPPYIVQQLELQLQQGQTLALRDLGSLLDRDSLRPYVLPLLQRYTLFTEEEFSWNPAPDKKQFLSFYYERQPDLHFSPLLQIFYITPIEERKVRFFLQLPSELEAPPNISLQLKQSIKSILEEWAVGDLQLILARLEQIQQLDTRESYYFFLELMRRQSFPKSRRIIYEKLAEKLVYLPNRVTAESLLDALEADLLSQDKAAQSLKMLTNVAIDSAEGPAHFIAHYRYLLDSLQTLDAVRQYGYRQQFRFSVDFFPKPVDYYGMILSYTDTLPWMQYNAIEDLKASNDPVSLFYLAGMFYRAHTHKNTAFPPDYYWKKLQSLLASKVGVVDKNGISNVNPDWANDRVALTNYLFYWAAYHSDYEWDSSRQQFIHEDVAFNLTETYERLFQRLNSKDDSVAMQAYQLLTEGDSKEIEQLAERYQTILRNPNPSIPSLETSYLVQLVRLTDYCRRNEISYAPRPALQTLLNKLLLAETPSERNNLENQILQLMRLEDLTPLEYWGCLQESHTDNTYSIGRILDRAYSDFWKNIIEDELELRLYLKKSFLFENLGTVGICNAYLNKFDTTEPEVQEQLRLLLRLEGDADIIYQVERLLARGKEQEQYRWQDVMNTDVELELLSAPAKKDYPDIFHQIKTAPQRHVALKLILYLSLHPDMDMVPELMYLLKANKTRNEAVALLETIYGYRFQYNGQTAAEQWLKHWDRDSVHYRNWGQEFIGMLVQNLKDSPLVDIQEINDITKSPFYQDSYRQVCLEALSKVQPVKNIRRLQIKPKLSVTKELKYLENIQFTYKELDDIPILFEIDDANKLVAFLEKQAESYNLDEQGAFCNNLFRSDWFVKCMNNGELEEKQLAALHTTLEKYLSYNSLLMSEFEEQTTILNIAQLENIGKTLEERLESSFQKDADAGAIAIIQKNIIAGISYKEIPVVVNRYAQLSPEYTYNFLNADFGLPIFGLDSEDVQRELIANHHRMTEYELYYFYLNRFGVEFTQPDGSLDFEKIYAILQYDIVIPFVGGGSQRDYYVYGIIKLLELHFGTRLGFHEKLNENQTFFTYSSSKRAAAWMRFLEEKNLIEPSFIQSPSFNMTVNWNKS